jgi:hypothetical protein
MLDVAAHVFFFGSRIFTGSMAVEAISPNGEKIFCLSQGKTIPEWMAMANKRTLSKNHGMLLVVV